MDLTLLIALLRAELKAIDQEIASLSGQPQLVPPVATARYHHRHTLLEHSDAITLNSPNRRESIKPDYVAGMAAAELEGFLYSRLMDAREKFRRRTRERRVEDLCKIAADTLGTPDGTQALKQANQELNAHNEALSEYRTALQAFNDFILYGQVPENPTK